MKAPDVPGPRGAPAPDEEAPPGGAAAPDVQSAPDGQLAREVKPAPGVQRAPGGRPAPGGFSDPGANWQRLSARSMVVRPLTDLIRLLPLLAGLLILHSRTGTSLAWGFAAAVIAVVTGLVHWATTRYLVTDERVYLRRGLLNKRMLSVARDRIRTVDVSAHLLHRLLGVCRVSIGTGRNDLQSRESFHLDGLTWADAESLRSLLLTSAVRPNGSRATAGAVGQAGSVVHVPPGGMESPSADGQPGGQGEESAPIPASDRSAVALADQESAAWSGDAEARELLTLSPRWLRFAPLTTTGLVVLGVLVGSVIQITNATNVNLATTSPVKRIVSDFAALALWQRFLIGGAVALAAYMLIATAGYVAVFWNFRLVRYGTDTLRVTRGLLSVRATTIALSRLRGAEISEPLPLRVARGARCIAITTGLHVGRGSEREGSVLVPPAPLATVQSVAADVLGVSADLCRADLIRHGPAARRRRYTRALAGAVALIGLVGVIVWATDGPVSLLLGSLALLLPAALLAADRYRSLGHRLTEGWLISAMGSLSRRRSIIGTDAIIGWRIHQTWFQRKQGLITLTATTAAGHQHYSVHDVQVAPGLAVASSATPDLMRPFLADRR